MAKKLLKKSINVEGIENSFVTLKDKTITIGFVLSDDGADFSFEKKYRNENLARKAYFGIVKTMEGKKFDNMISKFEETY